MYVGIYLIIILSFMRELLYFFKSHVILYYSYGNWKCKFTSIFVGANVFVHVCNRQDKIWIQIDNNDNNGSYNHK